MDKLAAARLGEIVGRSARIRMGTPQGVTQARKMLGAQGTVNGSDPWRQGRKPKGRKPDEPAAG